jgi:hypothetical protein
MNKKEQILAQDAKVLDILNRGIMNIEATLEHKALEKDTVNVASLTVELETMKNEKKILMISMHLTKNDLTHYSFADNRDGKELEVTHEFAYDDEAESALWKINNRGNVEVSMDVYDLEVENDLEDEEEEEPEYGMPVNATFFFSIVDLSLEDIKETISLIESV